MVTGKLSDLACLVSGDGELDASGRWVTLLGVDPAFARAVANRAVREPADRW